MINYTKRFRNRFKKYRNKKKKITAISILGIAVVGLLLFLINRKNEE